MRADDFIKKLEQDPAYIERMKKKEIALQERLKKTKIIEKPFIEDLHKNGFTEIKSSDNLMKLKKVSPLLVNIILKWLPLLDGTYNTREWMVKGLVMAEKPFDGTGLIKLFDSSASSSDFKWAIANTIACSKVLNIQEWLENKLNAEEQGTENEMLMYAAPKYLGFAKAEIIFIRLFDTFPLQIADKLSKIGTEENLKFLEKKIQNYKGSVRTQLNRNVIKFKKRLEKEQLKRNKLL